MVHAFVLIECAAGTVVRLQKKIREIEGVSDCHAVTGLYDLVVSLEGPDDNAIYEMSYRKIQLIDGVVRTVTCSVVDQKTPTVFTSLPTPRPKVVPHTSA